MICFKFTVLFIVRLLMESFTYENTSIFIFSFFCFLLFAACNEPKSNLINWRKALLQTDLSNEDKIMYFLQAANYYNDTGVVEQTYIKDSFLEETIKVAAVLDSIPLKVYVYQQALRITSMDRPDWVKRSLMLIGSVDKNEIIALYTSLINYYIHRNDMKNASRYLEKVRGNFDLNPSQSIQLLLLAASLNQLSNEPIDELANLLEAKNKSIQWNLDSLYIVSLSRVSDFYYFQKQYQTCITYVDKINDQLLKKEKFIDSGAFMWNKLNRAVASNLLGLFDEANANILLVYNYAHRHALYKLESYSESELRSNWINSNKFQELADFYTNDFP